jgi:hypothetical protein
MIEALRSLARPAFLPMTEQFDVSEWIACDIDGDGTVDKVRLNLEVTPPHMVFECSAQAIIDGTGVTVRDATESELTAILQGLSANPPKPQSLTPLEVLARFTDAEQDLIDTHAKRLARRLFSAIEPISWTTFAGSVAELQAAGLITAEQVERILA